MSEAHRQAGRRLPPYGLSNFRTLRTNGYAYVDKTRYLQRIEEHPNRHLLFLRPRRFGKSLWLSLLRHHYDLLLREHWEQLFTGLAAAEVPSPEHSAYRVLEFDFSGVATGTQQDAAEGMTRTVIRGVEEFLRHYGLGTDRDIDYLRAQRTAADALGLGLQLAQPSSAPLCVLIDEYDHFTNQLLTQSRLDFLQAVEMGGFVRTFYEVLKQGTKSCVGRIFITGVTPVTLDALTSGFNIATNSTLAPQFHDLLGFTLPEVQLLLVETLDLAPAQLPELLDELATWYDGYSFVPGAGRLFNPEMVLYYLSERLTRQSAPPSMLDLNIATDHTTIGRVLSLGDRSRNSALLEQILEEGQADVVLTRQYSLQRGFSHHDLGSLLFYLGFLSCRGQAGDRYLLGIPNRVIGELHWRMLLDILLERAAIEPGTTALAIADAVHALGLTGNPRPLLDQVSMLLEHRISNRDLLNFHEKHLKMIFFAYLSTTELYLVQSESEVERGYVDLLLTARPAISVNWEHAFELKYLASQAPDEEVEAARKHAEEQMRGYLSSRALAEREKLIGWVVVFRGATVAVLQRV